MNLFQTFFPLALLVVVALVGGWLIPARPSRKDDPHDDIDAVLDHHRKALKEAREAASKAMKAAREANRELEHLANLRQHSKAS
jgi:hypothetical protein